MRAIRVHGRDDLRLDNIPPPVPHRDEAVVRVIYGGICGSDLHYWRDGASGPFVVRAPMVLGHEVVGVVREAAESGAGPAVGSIVAVQPGESCGRCEWCLRGDANLCAEGRYLGSAARWPHRDGAFADRVVVTTTKLVEIPAGVDLRCAALAEPAAIACHAVRRSEEVGGVVMGNAVLVVGAGPVGLLTMALSRQAGAAAVTAVDVVEQRLDIALSVGADTVMRPPQVSGSEGEGGADVAFECSGTAHGASTALRKVKRGGVVVMVGHLPDGLVDLPAGLVVTRELSIAGSLRQDVEFAEAVRFLHDAGPQLLRIVSHVVGVGDYVNAFTIAADRTSSSKVLLDFTM